MTAPSLLATAPFVALLLAIALFPIIPSTERWWHKNRNKLLVSGILALLTLGYYLLRGYGYPHEGHALEPGWTSVVAVLDHAVLKDFVPFIVVLLSLYTISGGIRISGDIPAHPATNTFIIALGGLLASFIGTTGASMLLIRPLLEINRERKLKVHTVVFFIFVVSNIGGSLLPIGDPPLFLGYLRGVPFLWTFSLVWEWAFCCAALLAIYYIWDSLAWRRESPEAIRMDETERKPIRIEGKRNFVLLVGVILAVGLLVPGKYIFPFGWKVPKLDPVGLREIVQLALAGVSLLVSPRGIRKANEFNFFPINEVAALFIGLFITMQVPIEILNLRGRELGLESPAGFFWATGLLSTFLDNAPTYVVFFQTAGTLEWPHPNEVLFNVDTATGAIASPLLVAISCGAVFMGANSYIGNAPNFMVKSIAEHSGVKMPSFFGFFAYSLSILIPLFIAVTLVFFR
ncbi:MAG: hypothetical protein GHCLOJNM_00012 [bacterium]|nr:hypothetical protein [bacterium]